MSKICENCPLPMLWNDYKKRWECPKCSYGEFETFGDPSRQGF